MFGPSWTWYKETSQKSRKHLYDLFTIIGHPLFQPEDISSVYWNSIPTQLKDGPSEFIPEPEDNLKEWDNMPLPAGGNRWVATLVYVSISVKNPIPKHSLAEYCTGEFFHRPLFYHKPYELWWQPGSDKLSQRLHGELYTSEVFLKVNQKLQDSPAKPGCTRPRYIIAMMLGLDETYVAQFGNTKLWPSYCAWSGT
ncbi:hypothetical protein OF83DRAFT_1087781 [Amylostereum chailletii]|nr:hypothetical protein OF83DRAFT_1087781 [Amylostereum chailletii]